MQHLTLLTLGLAAASSASLLARQIQCSDPTSDNCLQQESDYLQQVCMPTNSTGDPDFNAPCNQVQAITVECIYGSTGLSSLTSSGASSNSGYGSDGLGGSPARLSNSTQRECVCESQFFGILAGCNDCYNAHGGAQDGVLGTVAPSFYASASSSYCAVTNTPTVGFDDVLYGFATGSVGSSVASAASTASASSFSDPVGNKTAVSYYFTPSVTGSSAWIVAQATESVSNSTASGSGSASGSASSQSASVATSNGQIVATAGAASKTSGSATGTASGASGTASTTGSSGAGKQEAAAVAGVIALAGFVILL
ncbi:hypothetical protein B0A55_02447 [Friedmanniomyces simplex]|uniref:Extracellular membrane protein CFEM domain-containing protein n=1 Tax=Friedmanniomyces simplex TaxID=329884 RepID=A0A4U0XWJ7_9PEZI|nr:hypothetical protein B0A55_02447 [Friedmanniomyces simplex]